MTIVDFFSSRAISTARQLVPSRKRSTICRSVIQILSPASWTQIAKASIGSPGRGANDRTPCESFMSSPNLAVSRSWMAESMWLSAATAHWQRGSKSWHSNDV
ncbi:LRR and PYD domains-containing protein,NACHT [Trichinella spiralis]|uniref:LRR and PYD domains-containing protein,NACHT n=2 Tax=Trichinella spiralis TaxID=6334 RepID=A0ABR3KL56_TRISP|nr:hypothetical protein T01_12686 [Trichinella spiralis]